MTFSVQRVRRTYRSLNSSVFKDFEINRTAVILYSTYMNSEKPILIVEDDPIQQNYMLTQLKHVGLTADVAGTSHEAIEKLASALTRGSPYKFIFLDIMLPDGTGHDLLVPSGSIISRKINI